MGNLEGRSAWVTGSAKGIGRALALHLADQGCRIAVHYRKSRTQAEKVAAAVEKRGSRAMIVQSDLTDPEQVRENVAAIRRAWRGLDILINNAGDFLQRPIERMTPEAFHRYSRGNLEPAVNTSLLVLPLMRKRQWGRIVNIGYVLADRVAGYPDFAAYHVGKTGLLAFTYSLARRAAQWGITVNMVSPGMNQNTVDRPKDPARVIPAGRLGKYTDLQNAVDFLIKEESEFVTGTHIKVSGGLGL